MASTASDLIKFEKMATGEKSGTWGTLANQAMSRIEESVHEITNISLNALGGANYTLDDTQYLEHDDATPAQESHVRIIKATGTLDSAEKIIVPLRNHLYLVWNATSGSFAVTVGGATGDAIEVPQGYLMEVICDGTNCEAAGLPVSVAGVARIDTIEFGHATDTTLARASAGDVNIEGNIVYRAGGTDVPVADGGTGGSSTTAYAVICGGTTSTAALQPIAGVGTAAQVLTSNGAGALPTFQDISGGGPSLGTDSVIRTNKDDIGENITFVAGDTLENGMSVGPITINSGFTVTVASGCRWVII